MALLGARPGIAPDESGDWRELMTPQTCRHVWTPKNWEGHVKVTCFPCFPVLYLHFFLDISIRMQNSPRLPGCMSVLIQVAVNYEIGRIIKYIYIYLYCISIMGTLLGECLPSIGPTFSREFPRWPAVRPSVLSRFSKCEGPNEAAWPWQKAGRHDFFASPEVVATI